MTTTRSTRPDIYATVTNRIVEALERDVRPWQKPWNADHAAGRISRPLRHTGEPYKGINILMLWDAADTAGYACPIWLTFRQALELGGHVRKGEHGSPVVYASTFRKTDTSGDGQEIEEEIRFLRQYTAFNVEQCDGLPERFYALAEPPKETMVRLEQADRFIAQTGATVEHGGNLASYSVATDVIRMPPFETFRDAESHAATLLHELTHWTRHPSRLDRDLGRQRFGDAGYAMEELVAELGAAFVCADLQITPGIRDDHTSYIHDWLKVLKDDRHAIFTAASHASKAADYLYGLQPV